MTSTPTLTTDHSYFETIFANYYLTRNMVNSKLISLRDIDNISSCSRILHSQHKSYVEWKVDRTVRMLKRHYKIHNEDWVDEKWFSLLMTTNATIQHYLSMSADDEDWGSLPYINGPTKWLTRLAMRAIGGPECIRTFNRIANFPYYNPLTGCAILGEIAAEFVTTGQLTSRKISAYLLMVQLGWFIQYSCQNDIRLAAFVLGSTSNDNLISFGQTLKYAQLLIKSDSGNNYCNVGYVNSKLLSCLIKILPRSCISNQSSLKEIRAELQLDKTPLEALRLSNERRRADRLKMITKKALLILIPSLLLTGLVSFVLSKPYKGLLSIPFFAASLVSYMVFTEINWEYGEVPPLFNRFCSINEYKYTRPLLNSQNRDAIDWS